MHGKYLSISSDFTFFCYSNEVMKYKITCNISKCGHEPDTQNNRIHHSDYHFICIFCSSYVYSKHHIRIDLFLAKWSKIMKTTMSLMLFARLLFVNAISFSNEWTGRQSQVWIQSTKSMKFQFCRCKKRNGQMMVKVFFFSSVLVIENSPFTHLACSSFCVHISMSSNIYIVHLR